MTTEKPDKLRSLLETLTGTRAAGLLKFHDDHAKQILSAKGSSHNHQAWVGGYHDHILHCFILAQDLYPIISTRMGYRNTYQPHPLQFSLESAIVVLYLHDIEKIFKYSEIDPDLYSQQIKESKDAWYLGILPLKYDVHLDDQEYNALKYAHGEGDDHRKDKRIMSPLGAFCHSIDTISARIFHNKPELIPLSIRMVPNGP